LEQEHSQRKTVSVTVSHNINIIKVQWLTHTSGQCTRLYYYFTLTKD